MARPQQCRCGSKEFPEALYDGHGIFICYVCSHCKAKTISRLRPDIFEAYKCDEPIEADEY